MTQPIHKHLTAGRFLTSARDGILLGIAGYWMVAYLAPTIHDLLAVAISVVK